jgi:hypothetical protein
MAIPCSERSRNVRGQKPLRATHFVMFSKKFQKFLRLTPVWELFFFGQEFPRVNASSAASHPYGVFQMQHLMEHDVVDCVAWNLGTVKQSADDDRVVRWIIMT